MKKLRIIVGGFLGILPAGGVTWDYIQYPLGLLLMGHDVFYIEDTRLYPIYQKAGSQWDDCTECVTHLSTVMNHFGMAERWAYRDEASGKTYGLAENRILEICKTADIFINISCSTVMREEYAEIPARVLIDSDPMFTQIQYITEQSFTEGVSKLKELVNAHNFHFTFGENMGAADCLIPDCGINWQPTRQPICLKYWDKTPTLATEKPIFTTLMNWTAGKNLMYQNEEWGQKDVEFPKIIAIPSLFRDSHFSIVINQTGGKQNNFPETAIKKHGWHIESPEKAAGNWADYQRFINHSFAELSVAKNTYVKARTGWFSCRSACYLAAGRPVITQDTGWSKYIPSGKGLFAFSNQEEAIEAVKQVISEPKVHIKAAKATAKEYFDSEKVLNKMLECLT